MNILSNKYMLTTNKGGQHNMNFSTCYWNPSMRKGVDKLNKLTIPYRGIMSKKT